MAPMDRSERHRLMKSQAIDCETLMRIVESTRSTLSADAFASLKNVVDSYLMFQQELAVKGMRIGMLRRLFLGFGSEATQNVTGAGMPDPTDAGDQPGKGDIESGDSSADTSTEASVPDESAAANDDEKPKPKRKRRKGGNGRNSAADYTGAEVINVPHETLQHKSPCPECFDGKVYMQIKPAVIVRITGMSPLGATVYNKARLRCNLCNTVFTAESPDDIGDNKYDETASATIGMLRYGYGLPWYRIEKLCGNQGIPMPSSTQWDVVNRAEKQLACVFDALVSQAAQGDLVYIDDTRAKVLDLNAELQQVLAKATKEVQNNGGKGRSKLKRIRTGVCTTGIVSDGPAGEIVLFFTGANHAGENLEALLNRRDTTLGPPIQMADGLSHNTAGDFETLLACCMTHGRRQFIDVVVPFPDAVEHVLNEIKLVYGHDAEAKQKQLDPQQRLDYHKKHSKPVMDRLEAWLHRQLDDKIVEPNSRLGGAIYYMLDHWLPLTLFLRVAGAPIDNNLVERMLKRVIVHRKNSLFYKTENGARVGDCFMSLIVTAERHGENAFEYLVAVQRHHAIVAQSPANFMPWNFRKTMAALGLS